MRPGCLISITAVSNYAIYSIAYRQMKGWTNANLFDCSRPQLLIMILKQLVDNAFYRFLTCLLTEFTIFYPKRIYSCLKSRKQTSWYLSDSVHIISIKRVNFCSMRKFNSKDGKRVTSNIDGNETIHKFHAFSRQNQTKNVTRSVIKIWNNPYFLILYPCKNWWIYLKH